MTARCGSCKTPSKSGSAATATYRPSEQNRKVLGATYFVGNMTSAFNEWRSWPACLIPSRTMLTTPQPNEPARGR